MVRKKHNKGDGRIAPVSDAKKRANKKWENNNCKQIWLVLPNVQAERLVNFCKKLTK